MDSLRVILGMIELAGGEIHGRTTVQKLGYFATQAGLMKAEYKPHYYGPYSEEVASMTSTLTSLGLVSENTTVLGPQQDAWLAAVSGDKRIYTYAMTSKGKALVKQIREESPRDWAKLEKLAAACKSATGLSARVLATAAKVHYLLPEKGGKRITADDVVKTAKGLGWKLTRAQVHQVTELLINMGFVVAE